MATATLPQPAPPTIRRRLSTSTPALLLRACHPRQAFFTTLALTAAAALSGRSDREVALVALTVLTGQVVLGWHNDLVDTEADQRHQRIKPATEGLDGATLSFWLICALLLVVPLAINNSVTAGCYYLASLGLGLLGNLRHRLIRMGPLSWLTWAGSFALYPAFLSYGGWGGQSTGQAPSTTLVVLCALLGLGVHVFTALWGLIADDTDGWRYLPLWLARRIGATRVLLGSIVYLGILAAAIAIVAQQSGLAA